MKNVMGVINLGNEQSLLEEITQARCPAAVPFGSGYRLIDFVLSNMVNSGIQNIGIFALDRFGSLLEHLGSGKEWDLDRRRDGLFILPPALLSPGGFKGDVQNFYGHLEYFAKSGQEYILLSSSIMVYNFNYQQMLFYHLEKEADITILYAEHYQTIDDSEYAFLGMDEEGRITSFNNFNKEVKSSKVSMETLILKKSLFVKLIKACFELEKYDFIKDAVIANLHKMKIYGYPFRGNLSIVNSLASYYRESMKLLNPKTCKELFFKEGRIYTKVINEPPTKYAEKSEVKNSLLATGCIIEGKVENSILFRGVKVKSGATVKNSVIMQRCEIGKDAVVENSILDKEVCIADGEKLIGEKFVAVGKRNIV